MATSSQQRYRVQEISLSEIALLVVISRALIRVRKLIKLVSLLL